MPATPWKALGPVDPGREYLVLLSFLPLRRLWRLPWFALLARRIRHQVERAPGVVGYSLRSRLARGHFWTLSAWEDEAALQAFVHAPPHRAAMHALVPHMGPSRFVRWTVRGTRLPVSWDDALRR